MTDESGMTAKPEEKKTRRGPKTKAEIEAEIRAELEAELAQRLEAAREEGRAEVQAVQAEAADDSPVNGLDIGGNPETEGAITIHFVEDGFTLLGKVWYRGEELTVEPGTNQWDESMVEVPPKGSGVKKMALLFDEFEQETKWGRRFFRPGPWRGESLLAVDTTNMTPAEIAQLEKAEKIRVERYGAVAR